MHDRRDQILGTMMGAELVFLSFGAIFYLFLRWLDRDL